MSAWGWLGAGAAIGLTIYIAFVVVLPQLAGMFESSLDEPPCSGSRGQDRGVPELVARIGREPVVQNAPLLGVRAVDDPLACDPLFLGEKQSDACSDR